MEQEQKNTISEFFGKIKTSLEEKSFIRLTLSSRKDKTNELTNLLGRVIETKKGERLSLTYRYQTKDIEKNFSIEEAIGVIENTFESSFENIDLFTKNEDYHLVTSSGKAKISVTKPTYKETPDKSHNKLKTQWIPTEKNIYLKELGVTDSSWQVKKTMQDKYRQINKYIEIIDSLLPEIEVGESINFADMGSGKGYLTFALYDYLTNKKNLKVTASGIEFRNDLVSMCNKIAEQTGFTNLKFKKGTIESEHIENIDILIALHACDTATDDAIFKGIESGAKLIVCAPCCHKQIRKELNIKNDFSSFLKHGILAERQSEIITDGLRALFMELHGYKTKVFEFISNEHTAKNIMIVGKKGNPPKNSNEIMNQIKTIKDFYGIKSHYLETLFK